MPAETPAVELGTHPIGNDFRRCRSMEALYS